MKSIQNQVTSIVFPIIRPCDFCDDDSFYVECPVCQLTNHVTFLGRKVTKVRCDCGVNGIARL